GLDPCGNVRLGVSAVSWPPPERGIRVVIRECLIAYAVLLVFLVGGHAFLALMHLSETSLSIAGGVILFLIALRMVFSHTEGVFGTLEGTEPFIVQLAIPGIAGPSALATVMLKGWQGPGERGGRQVAVRGAMTRHSGRVP